MKKFSQIFVGLLFMFSSSCQAEIAETKVFSESVEKIAEAYGCYADQDHYNNNEEGVRPPYYWGVVKGFDASSSIVFWCDYKEKSKPKSKIVIHVKEAAIDKFREENVFSECSNQIMDVTGTSTGIWIENNAIYTGFEDGIYYFCKDGEWNKSDWH